MVHVIWQLRQGAEPTGDAVEDQVVFPDECSLKEVSPLTCVISVGAVHVYHHYICEQGQPGTGSDKVFLDLQIPNQPRCYELHFPADASRSLFFW